MVFVTFHFSTFVESFLPNFENANCKRSDQFVPQNQNPAAEFLIAFELNLIQNCAIFSMDGEFKYLLADYNISNDENVEDETKVPQYQYPFSFSIFQLLMTFFKYTEFKDKILFQEIGHESISVSDNSSNNPSSVETPSNLNDIKPSDISIDMKSQMNPSRILDTGGNFQNFISAISNFEELPTAKNDSRHFQIEERLLDRNVQISDMFQYLAETSAVPTISQISLDNSPDVNSTIQTHLSSIHAYNPVQMLFYSDLGIESNSNLNIPYQMLIVPQYTNLRKDPEEQIKFNKKMADLMNRYIKLSFILGSRDGIPVILLFGKSTIVEISDGITQMITTKDKIFANNFIIYGIYYCLNGFETNFSLKNPYANNSLGHHPEIYQSDNYFFNLIYHKNRYTWNQQRNFVDFMIEAIRYPAFFGVSYGLDLKKSCFVASIIIGVDEKSAKSLYSKVRDNDRKGIEQTIHMYGKFTFFIIYLIQFLKLIQTNCQNDNELKKYGALLFKSIPANNKIIFDFFASFMIETIKLLEQRNQKSIAKQLNYFLVIAIQNYSFPEMDRHDIPDLRDAFEYYLTPKRLSPFAAMKELKDLCGNPNIMTLFNTMKSFKDQLTYAIHPHFNEFLSSYFNPVQIYF